MGFWDIIKKGIILEGIDRTLHRGDKKKESGYDPGAWRREIDRENDSFRHFYSDEDDF